MVTDPVDVTIRCTGEPMLFYFGTDGFAYRLDDGHHPKDIREKAFLRAVQEVARQLEAPTNVPRRADGPL